MERGQLKVLWDSMSHTLNEMQRRQYAATLSKAYGYGGATVVHEITGLALNTITRGKKELSEPAESKTTRVREPGGGPKWTEEKYPDIREHIQQIVEDSTYGNPEKILSWTTDSLRDIKRKLSQRYREKITHVTAGSILEDKGYRRQGNQKMLQVGEAHPDRNAQFEFINAKAREFIEADAPVISVDTNKEGKHRKLQESRHGIPPGQRPAKSSGPRFSDKRTGKNRTIRRVLPEQQHGICESWNKPRHTGFRGGKHIAVVVLCWTAHVSPCDKTSGNLRLWRQQRVPEQSVEISPGTISGANRT
jgi:hypothetical protein